MDDATKKLSTGQAGKILGVDSSQVRRYILEGLLAVAGRTPGGHARVRISDVQRLRERDMRSTKNESV